MTKASRGNRPGEATVMGWYEGRGYANFLKPVEGYNELDTRSCYVERDNDGRFFFVQARKNEPDGNFIAASFELHYVENELKVKAAHLSTKNESARTYKVEDCKVGWVSGALSVRFKFDVNGVDGFVFNGEIEVAPVNKIKGPDIHKSVLEAEQSPADGKWHKRG